MRCLTGSPLATRLPPIPTRGVTLARVLWSTPLLGCVLAVLSWPVAGLVPGAGLDSSWQAALHVAAVRGLNFGTQIVWTYGPAGFLRFPFLYYGPTAVVAWLYAGFIQTITCIGLIWAGRRVFPTVIAFFLGLAVAKVQSDPVLVAVYIGCVAFIAGALGQRQRLLLSATGGAVTATELLGKMDTGIAVAAMTLATLIACGRRNRTEVLSFTGGFALLACAIWIGTRQALTALPNFVFHAASITAGYSAAMQGEFLPGAFDYVAAGALALLLMGLVYWRADELGARTALLVVTAIVLFVSFKHTFVRHDPAHSVGYFAVCAGVVLATVPASRFTLPLALLAAVAAWVPLLHISRAPVNGLLDPTERASRPFEQARTLASTSRRAAVINATRLSLMSIYPLPSKLLNSIGTHTVHIWPYEAEIAWAYPGLRWHPLPVPQGYSAYTRSLDELNAHALASDGGPQRVLRGLGDRSAIDGRFPPFEQPAARLALFCNYTQVASKGPWSVLTKGGDRCGVPRLIATARTRPGQKVRVPGVGPAALEVARIDRIGGSLAGSLRNLVFRAPVRTVTLNGGPRFRLITATAGEPLLMRVPRPLDYPGDFRLSSDVRSIAVSAPGHLRIRFYAIPLSGPATTPRP